MEDSQMPWVLSSTIPVERVKRLDVTILKCSWLIWRLHLLADLPKNADVIFRSTTGRTIWHWDGASDQGKLARSFSVSHAAQQTQPRTIIRRLLRTAYANDELNMSLVFQKTINKIYILSFESLRLLRQCGQFFRASRRSS